jgi:hypothetical protein
MKPWHPDTCGIYCAVMHCQDRCGALAAHGQRHCTTCQRARRIKI